MNQPKKVISFALTGGPLEQGARMLQVCGVSFAGLKSVRELKSLLRHIFDYTIPITFGIALCMLAPLKDALRFGADEGYELMKGLLVSGGHPLYREIWNDQPPLHTELLALLFRVFGPSAYVGRLLSVCCSVLLVGLLYALVRRRSGRGPALIAVIFLISSSFFLELSVSVMLELPAMTLALAAVWVSECYISTKRRIWLVLSGALFGCALQVKFTAVMVLPALVGNLVIDTYGSRREWFGGRSVLRHVMNLIPWVAGAAATFCLIAFRFYGPETFRIFWASHFSGARDFVDQKPNAWTGCITELGVLVPALAGITLIYYKRLRNQLFPVVFLGTACLIHCWHRPYWYYYCLHFTIPLAWLGSVGVVELFRTARQITLASDISQLRCGFVWVCWCLTFSIALTFAPRNAWRQITAISMAPLAKDDLNLTSLRKYSTGTHWAFSDDVIYPFWAGLPVPPELAVIVKKRIFSGEINRLQIIECLDRYRPEQILLFGNRGEVFRLSDYLDRYYSGELTSETGELYVRKK